MKGSWPKVSASWSQDIVIRHALAHLGNPEPHEHPLRVEVGWTHEINPGFGHTFPLDKTQGMVRKLLALVDGVHLNDVMPEGIPPTSENLACWLLARCPGFIDFIEIHGYRGYRVRAERGCMRAEMVARYLAGAPVLELTT